MTLNRYTGSHQFDIGSYNSYNKKITGLLADGAKVRISEPLAWSSADARQLVEFAANKFAGLAPLGENYVDASDGQTLKTKQEICILLEVYGLRVRIEKADAATIKTDDVVYWNATKKVFSNKEAGAVLLPNAAFTGVVQEEVLLSNGERAAVALINVSPHMTPPTPASAKSKTGGN